jgi:hypothetical protein
VLATRHPNLPYILDEEDDRTFEDYLTTTKDKMLRLHHIANENQKKTKGTIQERYNRRKLAKFPYSKGDQVLVNSSIIPSERGLANFSKPFVGPYSVTDLKYPNVTLNIHGQEKTYHSNYVKPYTLPINLITFLICSFFISLVMGNESISPYHNQNGILFNRLGHGRLHTSDWNLITCFNLNIFSNRLSVLQEITNTVQHAEAQYNETNFFPLMSQQLERVQNLQDNILQSVESSRVKRGLINAVSVLQKTLWGTPSAYDADEWNENIGTLQHNSELQRRLLSNQFQYVNNTVKGFVNSVSIFQNNMEKVSAHIRALESHLLTQSSALNTTLIRQSLLILQSTFVESYLQTYSELYSLQDAIVDAKRDLLHPTILTPHLLLTQMQSHLLPKDQEYPLPTTVEMVSRYLDISSVHTKILGNNQLTFVLTIPLVENTLYNIIRLIPLPFAETYPNTIFHYIAPQAPFLFSSTAAVKYSYLNDLSRCHHLETEYYMCDVPTIQRTTKPTCELQLLRLQPGYCNVTSMPAVSEIWEQLNPNNWVFVLNNRQTITISCPNKTNRIHLLPNTGFLSLLPGCSATTKTISVHVTTSTLFSRHSLI